MARSSEPQERWTLCTSCNGPLRLSTHAKSVACTHCHARVVTESLEVDGYVAVRRFATANRMHIQKKGIVFADVRADELVVDGTLTGEATSMTSIHLGKTAKVKGALRAATLALDPGATFSGSVRIGPDQVPELRALTQVAEGTTPDG
jgi:cytoskeletal protein CcmA (bactofilin family)